MEKPVLDIFKDLGFSVFYSTADKSEIGLSNFEEYEGVTVKLDTINNTYIISASNLKFFGTMILPEMSADRDVSEIVKMLEYMKYCYILIENNQPW